MRADEQLQVQEGNVLMVGFLSLCRTVSLQAGAHFHEHPDDPEEEVGRPPDLMTPLEEELERARADTAGSARSPT